jgi:hypothetical protein
MIIRSPWLRASVLAALIGAVSIAAAADPPPQPRPCRELTGEERTKCEQQAREPDAAGPRAQPPAADEDDAPPPDTKSESDEQSDTADPPQA